MDRPPPRAILKLRMQAISQIPDETAVVLQAREGDAKAFSELVRRYENKIPSRAKSRLGTRIRNSATPARR